MANVPHGTVREGRTAHGRPPLLASMNAITSRGSYLTERPKRTALSRPSFVACQMERGDMPRIPTSSQALRSRGGVGVGSAIAGPLPARSRGEVGPDSLLVEQPAPAHADVRKAPGLRLSFDPADGQPEASCQ